MKAQNISVRILAALFVYAATQLSAEAGLPTIEPVTSFGPFPFGDNTFPRSINSNGDIAGDNRDQDFNTQGFVRFRNGSHLIIDPPNSIPGYTNVSEINDSGLIAGGYVSTQREGLAFFLSGGTYTDVMVPGAFDTVIDGLNNAGDFCGMADFPSNHFQPYMSIGGNVTLFRVPGVGLPFITYVGGMNNLNQVVGSYSSEAGVHGYLRNPDGTFTFPIDYPGALDTVLLGINDKGWMVGYYIDTESTTHGLFLRLPTDFVAFDFPRSTYTVLSGINNQGVICGSYVLHFGVTYGLVARVHRLSAE